MVSKKDTQENQEALSVEGEVEGKSNCVYCTYQMSSPPLNGIYGAYNTCKALTILVRPPGADPVTGKGEAQTV